MYMVALMHDPTVNLPIQWMTTLPFTMALCLCSVDDQKWVWNIFLNYNEAHHGKGPMDVVEALLEMWYSAKSSQKESFLTLKNNSVKRQSISTCQLPRYTKVLKNYWVRQMTSTKNQQYKHLWNSSNWKGTMKWDRSIFSCLIVKNLQFYRSVRTRGSKFWLSCKILKHMCVLLTSIWRWEWISRLVEMPTLHATVSRSLFWDNINLLDGLFAAGYMCIPDKNIVF